MSNRNFDSRVIIQRLQNQNYARNLYKNNVNGQGLINNPQNTDGDSSRYNTYISGAQTEYFRGLLGGGETISIGGIVNIPPFPLSTDNINSSPSPAPEPSPAPSPSPEIQLLINSEFTDIVSNGANGWTSSRGWDAWNISVGNKPTAVITMPIRAGVYPTSTSSGFVILTYISSTISQTVSNISLAGYNTITSVLNIVNVSNNATDTFTFQIQYKNDTDVVLYTSTTGNIQAPATWTDYTLTLTRNGNPNFDLIKKITVNITGIDSGFWAGQYGPAMDYCRLTIS
jgi:hypothetical protein